MSEDSKMSTGVTLLAILNCIVHLPGIFLLGFGLYLTIPSVFDATGLGAIFGIPMIFFGLILGGGLRASVLLFAGDLRGVKSIVRFSFLALMVLWGLYFIPKLEIGFFSFLSLREFPIPLCFISILYILNIFFFTRPVVTAQFIESKNTE